MAIKMSKREKLYEDDRLAIFKLGSWQTVFFECGEE